MSQGIKYIEITPTNNKISLQDINKKIIVIDNNHCTTTEIIQKTTQVVNINDGIMGPRGPQGIQGIPGEFPESGSISFTGSFNVSGSIESDVFSGSLFGTSSWAINAQTSSFAPDYLPLTGGTLTGNLFISNDNLSIRTLSTSSILNIQSQGPSVNDNVVRIRNEDDTSNLFLLQGNGNFLLGKGGSGTTRGKFMNVGNQFEFNNTTGDRGIRIITNTGMVSESLAGGRIYGAAGGLILEGALNQENIALTIDGNVGIGNTNPQVKLDVTGEIRSTIEYWTFDLMDDLIFTLYATESLSLTEITNIVSTPIITIEVNDLPYTLGNPIILGDKIKITSNIPSVIKIKIVK
jgi:hypothetical protein